MDTTEIGNERARWWEEFYREGRGRWSGKVNRSLAAEVAGLWPGTALDLGCGQGADAIWLAQQGWRVTAADISSIALEQAARAAAAAGLPADAIRWERHDLALSFPAGRFDLVASTFLHSPVELPRDRILRAAADAVAPGGTLLVIGHAPSDAHPHADLPTLEEVVAELDLPRDGWRLRTCELREVEHAFRDEAPTRRVDTIVRAERLGE
ncbi:class I SAM-dependent methyltransferase [Conexibacter arvalis]|uniref:SAM-dependent methyltransferase n=1 Tax=Conexibacter arvalis TaxID=912552 RepID=A0A840ID87_9ACTN|nr:class I SAM-dependent methyltransferase [Conexibacter arvalis]MBB4662193.1 SAM-dependent methyltransferase [Conexibacter arvalis]